MTRLTRREKLLVVGSATFVIFWLLFAFAVKPAMERAETLARVIPEKQRELEAFRAKAGEYITLRDRLRELRIKTASQDETFKLLPFLESLTRECGLEKKVASMKQQVLQLGPNYHETVVEAKLENLTLIQLIDFLWKLESSNVLARIKTLYIKKNLTNTNLLDSVVEIHTAKLTQH